METSSTRAPTDLSFNAASRTVDSTSDSVSSNPSVTIPIFIPFRFPVSYMSKQVSVGDFQVIFFKGYNIVVSCLTHLTLLTGNASMQVTIFTVSMVDLLPQCTLEH